MIKNCEFELRKAILFTKSTPMIDNITVEDVCSKGEVDLPDLVTKFYSSIIFLLDFVIGMIAHSKRLEVSH